MMLISEAVKFGLKQVDSESTCFFYKNQKKLFLY